jgi:hypothetical protein
MDEENNSGDPNVTGNEPIFKLFQTGNVLKITHSVHLEVEDGDLATVLEPICFSGKYLINKKNPLRSFIPKWGYSYKSLYLCNGKKIEFTVSTDSLFFNKTNDFVELVVDNNE